MQSLSSKECNNIINALLSSMSSTWLLLVRFVARSTCLTHLCYLLRLSNKKPMKKERRRRRELFSKRLVRRIFFFVIRRIFPLSFVLSLSLFFSFALFHRDSLLPNQSFLIRLQRKTLVECECTGLTKTFSPGGS